MKFWFAPRLHSGIFPRLIPGLLGLVVACGPVNQRSHESDQGGTGGAAPSVCTSPEGPVRASRNGAFLIHASIQSPEAQGGATDKAPLAPVKARMGKVIYLLRIVHGSSLLPVSKDSKLTVEYHLVKSKLPRKHLAQLDRMADGTYTITMELRKKGKWEISVKVQDGTTEDEQVLIANLES